MNTKEITVSQPDLHRLLTASDPDAALLYLYLQAGNDPLQAGQDLRMSQSRLSCAGATLRQMNLWKEPQRVVVAGERPSYSEKDVLSAMDGDKDFRALYGEVQRLLGRSLNTEEMKIVLGFVRYLGMSPDVVCVLICYCKERARQKGSLRNPSLRTIEKEAYHWAEQGIDTMEEAAAYIRNQNVRNSQLGKLLQTLQIHKRNLTPGEEKYALKWLDMGFQMDAIAIAYERTCLNTGGLNWAYMNKILTRWHEAGLHTAQQVQNGDKKPSVPKGASGVLGPEELENIQRLLREG